MATTEQVSRLSAFARVSSTITPKKGIKQSSYKKKLSRARPYRNVPKRILHRLQVAVQDILVTKIIECDGDFKKQSVPELSEIRNDIYAIYKEINYREGR